MTDSNEELILQELKRISRLLALSLIPDKASQTEQIETLDRYGFQQKEIANLLSTTPNVVSSMLSRIKKRTKSQKSTIKTKSKQT